MMADISLMLVLVGEVGRASFHILWNGFDT